MAENKEQIIEDDPYTVRLNKREALIAAGENPYGGAFDYTHHVSDMEKEYGKLADGEITEDDVRVAGRIMSKRGQGKVAFMGLRDATGDMQLFFRIDNLGDESYEQAKDLDVGDWIGV